MRTCIVFWSVCLNLFVLRNVVNCGNCCNLTWGTMNHQRHGLLWRSSMVIFPTGVSLDYDVVQIRRTRQPDAPKMVPLIRWTILEFMIDICSRELSTARYMSCCYICLVICHGRKHFALLDDTCGPSCTCKHGHAELSGIKVDSRMRCAFAW